MKCIFCNAKINDSNKSSEHIVPNFLGGKYATSNIVCKSCNNNIGSDFEQKLCEEEIIKFILSYFRIQTKSKNQVTPSITSHDGRMTIRADDDGYLFMHNEREITFEECVTPMEIDETTSQEEINEITSKKYVLHIEVDETTSQEEINKITTNKLKKLEKQTGEQYTVRVTNDETRLEEKDSEINQIAIDCVLFTKLFIKIAYEFACIHLDSSYLNDGQANYLKDIILGNQQIDKTLLNAFKPDLMKITEYANKVGKIASNNTKNKHNHNELQHVSNSDYIHEVSLIKRNGIIFVSINLFNLLKSVVLISENGNQYDLNENTEIKLITGVENGETINKLI